MERAPHFCAASGCANLTTTKYCKDHKHRQDEETRARDHRRGSAYARGYDNRWRAYSRAYLRQPEHVLCALRLPGCTVLAECVDHVDPPDGPRDPRFWDKSNHQPSCIHCNSVKGRSKLRGKGGSDL